MRQLTRKKVFLFLWLLSSVLASGGALAGEEAIRETGFTFGPSSGVIAGNDIFDDIKRTGRFDGGLEVLFGYRWMF